MSPRRFWLRTGNGGARIDTEHCCNGECNQGRTCPRYRAANDEPSDEQKRDYLMEAVVYAVVLLSVLGALLSVWP